MEKRYSIYTITLQGKVMYVGVTSNFEHRKYQHLTKKKEHSAIPDDIDVDSITFQKIEEFDNKSEAYKAEDDYIQKFNTIFEGWNQERSGLNRKDVYYQENRERILKRSKEYRDNNKDEINRRNRERKRNKKLRIVYYDL